MKERGKRMIWGSLTILMLVAVDQWVKHWVYVNLKGQPPIVWIREVFELTYVENRGAAFGIFTGWSWLFYLLTPISLGLIGVIFYRIPKERKYWAARWSCLLIMAGAVGNLLDRVLRGFVVDMFYFKLIDFAVFNVADAYVVVGIITLAGMILFWSELSSAMFPDKKKAENQEKRNG